jgi:hypothetical protein
MEARTACRPSRARRSEAERGRRWSGHDAVRRQHQLVDGNRDRRARKTTVSRSPIASHREPGARRGRQPPGELDRWRPCPPGPARAVPSSPRGGAAPAGSGRRPCAGGAHADHRRGARAGAGIHHRSRPWKLERTTTGTRSRAAQRRPQWSTPAELGVGDHRRVVDGRDRRAAGTRLRRCRCRRRRCSARSGRRGSLPGRRR